MGELVPEVGFFVPTGLGQAKVFANSDGTISIDSFEGPNGQLLKFEEVDPLFYREVNGRSHFAFKRDGDGQMQFQSDAPDIIFQKVGFWENKNFNYANLILSLGVIILTVVLWPVGTLVRKHYGHPLDLSPLDRRLRLAVRLVCILFISFFVGWAGVLRVGHQRLPQGDDRTRSLDSVFWSPGCNVCSRHDSRLCECIPELEDARQVDMGETARYRASPFLRGPDAIFNHLETHELQRALLSPSNALQHLLSAEANL